MLNLFAAIEHFKVAEIENNVLTVAIVEPVFTLLNYFM